MMPDPVLVLFDIDGTLLTTQRAGLRAMERVTELMFGPEFRWEVDMAGRLDPSIFAEAATANGIEDHDHHHQAFHDRYVESLHLELTGDPARTAVLPGVHEVLAVLDQREGVVLGLLTGNYRRAAPIKLMAAGIDPERFVIGAFGDDGKTRPDLTAVAMERFSSRLGHPCRPESVMVIGDTPHDVHCAKVHGCVAVGVATGRSSVAELIEAGADLALPSLSNPEPLLAKIDMMAAGEVVD